MLDTCPEKLHTEWAMKNELKNARETRIEGRLATCTQWRGGNGPKLLKTEQRQANKATRRRAKQTLKTITNQET
jgi:hypothetical protein